MRRIPFGIAFLALAHLSVAYAGLGSSGASVETDRQALSAQKKSMRTEANYTVHELEISGTSVREFVSASNVVFGIAWNGLTHPDLQKLLGAYASEYTQKLGQTPRTPGRRHHALQSDHVVVEKWGHMRNLQGRAYLPSLLPAGVTANEIK